MATWSAPVRYAEVDQQGVVFNSHYLLYCDEAMGAYCEQLRLGDFVASIRLVSSALHWRGPVRWGDVVDVDVRCVKIGRTSLTVTFDLQVAGSPCFAAETVYVYADPAGTPQPITDEQRATLTSPSTPSS